MEPLDEGQVTRMVDAILYQIRFAMEVTRRVSSHIHDGIELVYSLDEETEETDDDEDEDESKSWEEFNYDEYIRRNFN